MPLHERNFGAGVLKSIVPGGTNTFAQRIRQHKLNRQSCYEDFRGPASLKAVSGAVASGATGATNHLILGPSGNIFEYHIKGAGQTILGPAKATTGLDISLDQTDDEGIEIAPGILAAEREWGTFKVGEDSYYFRVVGTIADVSGTDDLCIGFRKAEAYQANVDDYDEAFFVNITGGNYKSEHILNNAATVTTDLTDITDIVDAGEFDVEVRVLANRVCEVWIGGVKSTLVPTTSLFDDDELIVPFIFFLHSADVAGAVVLSRLEFDVLSAKDAD